MRQPDLFIQDATHSSGGLVMPCVSLWQPWASLIACKLKPTETRSWPAPASVIGKRIAIHAAKTKKGMYLAVDDKPLWEACLKNLPFDLSGALPWGCIVATAIVEASIPTERLTPDIFGDYSPGRFGWMLTDVEALPSPIPWKGSQGIFNVPVSAIEGGAV